MIFLLKEPHELAGVFEYVPKQIELAAIKLLPLQTKLHDIYKSYKAEMIETCDREALIRELSNTDKPLSFLKLKFERFKEIKDKIREYEHLIEDLRLQAGRLMQERERLKFLNDMVPIQAKYIPDRFEKILDLLTSSNFIGLHDESKKRRNKKARAKMYRIVGILSSLVEDIKQMFTNDSNGIAKTAERFDADYQLIIHILHDKDSQWESSPDIDIDKNLKYIKNAIDEIYSRVRLIHSDIRVEETLVDIKTRLAEIEDELRTIDSDIQRYREPLTKLQESIDTKSYVFDLFWEHSLLYWNDYPQKIKNLFYYRDMINWDDAREKYALIIKVDNIFKAYKELFKQLSIAFERAERAYKQAKRRYNREGTYEANVAMQRLELHPTDVPDKLIELLKKLLLLVSNILNNNYINDTTKFFTDNYDMATDLFTNIEYGIQTWKTVFQSMFRE